MEDELLREAVIRDIVLLSLVGINIVLVHSGSDLISQMLAKLDIETPIIDGKRYVDHQTSEVVQQVLCGKINKDLVLLINKVGGRAVGLSGMDGGMIKAEKTVSSDDLGLIGDIVTIDTKIIEDCLGNDYIPVVSGMAQAVDDNGLYNINANMAAAEIAIALGAIKLILLTDVPGVLADIKDEDSLYSKLNLTEIQPLKRRGIIKDGIKPKVDCCVKALMGGVERTHIIDGRIEHSILIELFSDEGIGTMIIK